MSEYDQQSPIWGHIRCHPEYGVMVYNGEEYILMVDFLSMYDAGTVKCVSGRMERCDEKA